MANLVQPASTPSTQPVSIAQEASERYNQGYAFDRQNREDAVEDVNFLAGNQWDEDTLRRRKGRPTLTLNRMRQFVAQVAGEFKRNPPSIRCAPADAAADGRTAQVYEGLIRYIERQSQAQRVYSRAGEQAASAGIGSFRLALEWSDDKSFDLELRIRSIRNWNSVVWDPASVLDDKSDANWCCITSDLTLEQFKQDYPNASTASFGASRPFSSQWQPTFMGEPTVKVCEYWKVEKQPVRLVQMQHGPSGAVTVLEDPDEQLLMEAQMDGWTVRRERMGFSKRITMHLIAGPQELQEPIVWPGERIPVFTVVGEEIELPNGQTIRHGMIRHAKDSQRVLNQARSTQMERDQIGPKVPYLVADEQIAGYEDEWKTANLGNRSYLRYRVKDSEDGEPIGAPPPMRVPPVQADPSSMALAAAAIDDMKAATGVYDASLGARSNETSGVAIEARDAQAQTATYVYLDNLRLAIEAAGREMVNVIPKVYAEREMISILGEDDKLDIINLAEQARMGRGKYEVVVKTGPSFKTERDEQNRSMVEMLGIVPDPFKPIMIAQIAKNGDWKDADKLADAFMQIAVATGLLPPPGGAPAMGPGAPPMGGPMGAGPGAPLNPGPAGPPQMSGPGQPQLPPGMPPQGPAPRSPLPPLPFDPPEGTRRPPLMAGPGIIGAV